MLIDIKGEFSFNKFLERLRMFYDQNIFKKIKLSEQEKGGPQPMTESEAIDDKSLFIKTCF